MPVPGEHKTVHARILEYAEAEAAGLGQLRHHHTDIVGTRKFVDHLRYRSGFFGHCADVHCRLSNRTPDAFRTRSHEQHLDRG